MARDAFAEFNKFINIPMKNNNKDFEILIEQAILNKYLNKDLVLSFISHYVSLHFLKNISVQPKKISTEEDSKPTKKISLKKVAPKKFEGSDEILEMSIKMKEKNPTIIETEYSFVSLNGTFDFSNHNGSEFMRSFLITILRNNCVCEKMKWSIASGKEIEATHHKTLKHVQESVKFTWNEEPNYKSIIKKTKSNINELSVNIKGNESIPISNLDQEILNLWYLLFGCEVKRNPAALLHHCMMIDLIKKPELELVLWDDKNFQEENNVINSIPMFSKQAFQSAVLLNSLYKSFMPYPYEYKYELIHQSGDIKQELGETPKRGNESLFDSTYYFSQFTGMLKMISQESELVKKWLTFRRKNDLLERFNNAQTQDEIKDSFIEITSMLFKYLKNQILGASSSSSSKPMTSKQASAISGTPPFKKSKNN